MYMMKGWVLNMFLTSIVELDKENPIACGRGFSQVTLFLVVLGVRIPDLAYIMLCPYQLS